MRKIIPCCLGCGKNFTQSLFKAWCSLECKVSHTDKSAKNDTTVLDDLKKEEKKKLQKQYNKRKRAIKSQRKKETAIAKAKRVLRKYGLLPDEMSFGATSFYNSDAWRQARYRVIKRHGRVCMACGVTSGEMHVDHIKPRSKFPELELDQSNLQILCKDCNLGKSNKDQTDWRPKSTGHLPSEQGIAPLLRSAERS